MTAQAFVLIDGLLLPEALRQLYGRGETLEIDPLYLGTRWSPLKDKGPILVQASERLENEWLHKGHWHACSSLLYSQAAMPTLAAHLRRFLCPPDYLGNASLLRFADPLVLHAWLSSQEQAHLDRTLGPIEQLRVAIPRQPWHRESASVADGIATFARDRTEQAWESSFALQGPAQLEAFEQAYDFLFKRRLYDWITRETPGAFATERSEQIDNWLDHSLRSGRDWGLISEFALATWVRHSHALGLDFVNAPGSVWQQWQAKHPEQQALAPELRLDAFDIYQEQRETAEPTDE
ncbi:hypothetical protein PS3A_53060 [Pseudomonas sp. 3A(2025)]